MQTDPVPGLVVTKVVPNLSVTDGGGVPVRVCLETVARYQGLERYYGLARWGRERRSGHWPDKVSEEVALFLDSRESGVVQAERKDYDFLTGHLRKGCPVVVYDRGGKDSPYGGPVHTAVLVVHFGPSLICLWDPNFPGRYEWLTRKQFDSRWGGWALTLVP